MERCRRWATRLHCGTSSLILSTVQAGSLHHYLPACSYLLNALHGASREGEPRQVSSHSSRNQARPKSQPTTDFGLRRSVFLCNFAMAGRPSPGGCLAAGQAQ